MRTVAVAASLVAVSSCAPGPRPATTPRPAANRPPTVRLTCDPCRVPPGAAVRITATATDPDGDTLGYAWSCPTGEVHETGPVAVWQAPAAADGPVPVAVVVTDGRGGSASDAITVGVERTPPPP